jgi:predicted MPP superfamily phosphohydrolase
VTTKARWLHISDFHLKKGASYDRDRVLGSLIRSIPALLRRVGAIDFVVASGDIAFSGRKEEYDEATPFFDGVLQALQLEKSRLFVIPGNHDVDRTHNNALSRTLDTPQVADAYFSGESDLPHLALRQSAYSKWYDEYFSGVRKFAKRSSVCAKETLQIGDCEIEISLINSAIFSADDNDHGKLLIGRRSVESAYAASLTNAKALRLTIIHHPLSWISMVESANVKATLRDNSDLILSGHLHETDIEQAQGVIGSALHLSAGASYQGSKWPNTALICSFDGTSVDALPIQFVDRPRDTWTIDPSIFPEESSFSRTYPLARFCEVSNSQAMSLSPEEELATTDSALNSKRLWEEDLFTNGTGKRIYVDPRLMPQSQEAAIHEVSLGQPIPIDQIVTDDKSYIIETRSEYGGSNLAKRLAYEIERKGRSAAVQDSRTFPNYKAKIVSELIALKGTVKPTTLIFDNFDVEQHSRMLKELSATGLAARVVLIAVNRDVAIASLSEVDHLPFKLTRIFMWPFSREGVRRVTADVFDTDDSAFVSRTVDKVYSDLLSLCIPLTPPNVIMYLRVLVKENDFAPLNRVHIHQRYIREGLSKSADIYRGNFNAKNKIDVVAAFTFEVYSKKERSFELQDWSRFCVFHKAERLKEFDESDLLAELCDSGIMIKRNGRYFFRYSFFFNFFLGRYFAMNRLAFKDFLANESYLQVPAVIDVVTGLESENDLVLDHLTQQLNARLNDFGVKYVEPEFDPLLTALWPDNTQEQERLWNPIQEAIEKGPSSTNEIDELKTSFLAEARTDHQQVVYQNFTDLENVLFVIGSSLCDALRNSDDALADLKLAALDAILRMEMVAFQVGTMFAEKLATQRFFGWGGALFVDFDNPSEDEDKQSIEVVARVVASLSKAVATKIGEEIGTFKLANVFRSRAATVGEVGFLDVLLFSCILEAKGPGWADTINSILLKTGRNAFYLRVMLSLLMRNISTGLERGRDMDAAKRLVAVIHSKRGHNKQAPGEKLVSKMLQSLETKGAFSSDQSEEGDLSKSEGPEAS